MTIHDKSFRGFSKEFFRFFGDLEKNNNLTWFHKNKHRYQNFIVEPAKSFVSELSPFLNRLNPSIRTEPKFNQTLLRINKDMRFVKEEPYKTYFLIHFGRFKLDSEFYLYFDSQSAQIGLFINNTNGPNLFFKKNLNMYRKQIIDVCKKYKINNKYSLYELKKEAEPVLKKFEADKHLPKLENINYILFQKIKDPSWDKISSDKLVIEFIKMISNLYPLYCFAIATDPLKELKKYEENFGTIL
ncbi:MAG: hypothetical protein A2V66_18355 [Ignavibacteria bacterium RBG_13_36_8]|nr:MAG: hypothetical protein A2V66_18355 [Ignavibacteria bacterium RBG_13_36_8]